MSKRREFCLLPRNPHRTYIPASALEISILQEAFVPPLSHQKLLITTSHLVNITGIIYLPQIKVHEPLWSDSNNQTPLPTIMTFSVITKKTKSLVVCPGLPYTWWNFSFIGSFLCRRGAIFPGLVVHDSTSIEYPSLLFGFP